MGTGRLGVDLGLRRPPPAEPAEQAEPVEPVG
jgi:hypothetical protein